MLRAISVFVDGLVLCACDHRVASPLQPKIISDIFRSFLDGSTA